MRAQQHYSRVHHNYDTVANFLLRVKADTDTCKVTLCGDHIIRGDCRPMNELKTTVDNPLWIIREIKVYTKFDEGPTKLQLCSPYDTRFFAEGEG